MKDFLERYSYDSVRMAINQIAISIFGFALAMTSVKSDNATLMLVTGLGAILFYLMLNYGVAWRIGSGDKNAVDHGYLKYRPQTGLYVSLVANSVNLLLAVLLTIGALTGVQNLEGIPRFIAMLLQGMYMGVIDLVVADGKLVIAGTEYLALNDFWWTFFLLPLPSMLVSFVGYIAGVKDFHITKVGVPDLPASDRPTKQEKREQKKADKNKENHDKM